MNWRYVGERHIIIEDSLVELPVVGVNNDIHITSTVALDGQSIELAQAVRVLLAQRGFLQKRVAELEAAPAA